MVEVNCWIGAGTKPRLLIFRLVRKIVNSDSTVTFVMSVRPSAPPRGTARLPPVRFSWHLTLKIFWKSVKKFQYSLISDKNNGTVHEDRCTFVIISHWIFLRMRNASEKFWRQNGNIILCWVFFFFLENYAVYEIMWEKYCTARQTTYDNVIRRMRTACCIAKAHTLIMFNTYCLSTATLLTRKRLIVMLCVHSMFCLYIHLRLCT